MEGVKRKLRIGYYNHGHFYTSFEGGIYVPFDVALWADEFIKHSMEFVCLLNESKKLDSICIPDTHRLITQQVRVVPVGKQRSHWQKLMGIGLDTRAIKDTTAQLDVIIVQGPTPQQVQIVKNVADSCRILFLLVGLWKPWPKEMYRTLPLIRELIINILKWHTRYSTTKLINKRVDIFCGNNPQMASFYKSKKPFHLVSKGLVKNDEIITARTKIFNSERIVLTFYSRLDPEKYIELIFYAVEALKNRGYKIELYVFGESSSRKYLAFLKELINSLNLGDQIEIMGGIKHSERALVFAETDIYVFNTCTTEGFPRTIWEAYAYGVPTICSSFPGVRDFLEDRKNVVLFEQNNLIDLVEKLEELICDYSLREKIVQGAYKLLEENTLEVSVSKLVKLISGDYQNEK